MVVIICALGVLIVCFMSFSGCFVSTTKDLMNNIEDDYSIEMPRNFKVVSENSVTFIDGYKAYCVSSFTADYTLNYSVQLTSSYHDDEYIKNFSIEDKFTNITEVKTDNYIPDFSHNVDWVGFETQSGGRYRDTYVLVDYDKSYIYIYKDVHQW